MLEMPREVVLDPAPRFRGGSRVRADAHHAGQRAQRPRAFLLVVQEGVARRREFLDVVFDAHGVQRGFQPRGGAPQGAVPGAVVCDQRAGAAERRLEVPGEPAVVHGRRVEAVVGRQQREPSAHAEADDARPACAEGRCLQPAPSRGDVGEDAPFAGDHGLHGAGQAAARAAVAVEIDGEGEVAGSGQSVGVAADLVVEAERLVDHHDTGKGARSGRCGEVSPKVLGSAGPCTCTAQVYVRHGLSLARARIADFAWAVFSTGRQSRSTKGDAGLPPRESGVAVWRWCTNPA
jgi:hypothetical protein